MRRVCFVESPFNKDYFARGFFIKNPINTSHNFVLGLFLSHVEEDSTHLPSRRHKRQLIVVVNFRYGPTVLIREHHSLRGIPRKSYLNTKNMLVERHFSLCQMSYTQSGNSRFYVKSILRILEVQKQLVLPFEWL